MTARPTLTLRELVTAWKWLILPLGGILFALTVIFPQIGAFEWIALIPALLVILTIASDPTVKTNLCVVGGDAVAARVASILGLDAEKTERRVARVMCRGSADCTAERYEYGGIPSCKAAAQLYGGGKACRFGCLGFGDCVDACEFGAISLCNGVAIVNPSLCKACGKCVATCPKRIIVMTPAVPRAEVLCSNTDKGAATKAVCSVGCLGCKMCAKVCPTDAISFDGGRAVISAEKCIACGRCAEACKFNIIVMTSE